MEYRIEYQNPCHNHCLSSQAQQLAELHNRISNWVVSVSLWLRHYNQAHLFEFLEIRLQPPIKNAISKHHVFENIYLLHHHEISSKVLVIPETFQHRPILLLLQIRFGNPKVIKLSIVGVFPFFPPSGGSNSLKKGLIDIEVSRWYTGLRLYSIIFRRAFMVGTGGFGGIHVLDGLPFCS